MRQRHPLRHEALKDTLWVGKGASPLWIVVGAILVGAFIAIKLFG